MPKLLVTKAAGITIKFNTYNYEGKSKDEFEEANKILQDVKDEISRGVAYKK